MTLAPYGVILQCAHCPEELAGYVGESIEHTEDGAHVHHMTYGTGTPVVTLTPVSSRFVEHVGWGGTTRTIETDMDMGRGVWRTPDYGIRCAVWDAAFGYVSGFRKRDILYFLLTRSLSRRIEARVIARETRDRQKIQPHG